MEKPAYNPAIPPALLAQIQTIADENRRSADDLLRDVIERGLREIHVSKAPEESAVMRRKEAASRIRKLREGNILPDTVTIRDLTTYGRS